MTPDTPLPLVPPVPPNTILPPPPSYSPILAAEFLALFPHPLLDTFNFTYHPPSICIHFLLNITTLWLISDLVVFAFDSGHTRLLNLPLQ
jgi:hypothetical protein